jgi:thiamine pyrophosphokinase
VIVRPGARRGLLLANGDVPPRTELDAAWPGWDTGLEFVIAADGGARHAAGLGLRLDAWVGDGDSLAEREIADLRAAGVSVRRVAADKDETDTELALLAAIDAGVSDLTILGALGGLRVDHGLANLGLLAHAALAGREVRILGDGGVRISLVSAPGPDGRPVEQRLDGRPGDVVSLLPLFGPVEGVATEGLRFPLRDEPLAVGPARGISNVRLGSSASVRVRAGRLLVVETPASLG